jgi:DNA repair exonuclease SbcCD ATPase subunit
MAKYFIKSISIEGFRGINNTGEPLIIPFQTDGVTSIFGENGKGKSSIFEAFLFSILGRIVRFDDYHGDIKDKKTIKNLFHNGDGIIIIEFIDETNITTDIKVKVNANGERSISSIACADPERFLSSLNSTLNYLDYKSFEKIILTSSEDTGKLFANLVGFGSFINIKDKFDKITRTTNINNDFGKNIKENSIQANNKRISELETEIKERLAEIDVDIEPINKLQILKTINIFLLKEYGIKRQPNTKNNIDFDGLIKLKIGTEYEENTSKLIGLEESLKLISQLKKGIIRFTNKFIISSNKKLKNAYRQLATPNDIILGKLYDDALKGYETINDYNKNTCILCNTEDLGDHNNTFYDKINLRIKSYKRFKDNYYSFYNDFVEKIRLCSLMEIENHYLDNVDSFFTKIERTNDYIENDFFEINNLTDIILSYNEKISNEIIQISNSIKQLKILIPPKISDLVDKNNTFMFVFDSIKEIEKLQNDNEYNRKYLAELENWTTFSSKIKGDYENAYNTLMDEIATSIDLETKLFFKEIMGEIDIIPKLKKENRGQKVNILLEKFHNNTTDIKAASLLSESYRNALSLSIYFAAALKSKNSGNFIIVDDITSSFDSGHQLYLLDLIKRKISISPSNKNGKQIIFLTHDGLLKKVLNENNTLKNWTHYSLNSNKDMVSLKPFKSDDLKLIIQEKINSGNYVGSDFRLYYEFVLLEIIEKLNLEIPFSLIDNNENKMVNKLSLAIQEIIEMKRLSGRIRGVRFPVKDDFKLSTQQLSNNLSHWSSGREISLSDAVLNRIISDIDNFKKLFQYNCTCRERNAGWVYYKSLTSPKHKGCNCTII